MTSISVFLPSYNKGEYVLDAMRSVFAQTRQDWELWILENSTDDGRTRALIEAEWRSWREANPGHPGQVNYELLQGEEIERQRREKYITAWLLNVYYPEAHGEYIFYLSDDDLIDPDCFEVMAGELDENPNYQVVYAGLRVGCTNTPGQVIFPDVGIPAQDAKSFPGSVDCKLDGGQIMHRTTCLDALVPPYFEESPERYIANHADGAFLERLVGRFIFWPIDRYLITHRRTEKSLWTKIA